MVYAVELVCDHFVVRRVGRKYGNGYYVGYCALTKGMARCAMANEIESDVFRDRKEAEQRIIRYFERSTKQGTFAEVVGMFGQKGDQ